jgi:hypothetical protein
VVVAISRRAPSRGDPRPTRAFPASPRAPRAKNIRSTLATNSTIVRAPEGDAPVESEMAHLERTTAKPRFPLAAATPAAPDRARDPAPGTREMRDLFFVRPDVINFNASYGTPVREVRTATSAKAGSRVFHLLRLSRGKHVRPDHHDRLARWIFFILRRRTDAPPNLRLSKRPFPIDAHSR